MLRLYGSMTRPLGQGKIRREGAANAHKYEFTVTLHRVHLVRSPLLAERSRNMAAAFALLVG